MLRESLARVKLGAHLYVEPSGFHENIVLGLPNLLRCAPLVPLRAGVFRTDDSIHAYFHSIRSSIFVKFLS